MLLKSRDPIALHCPVIENDVVLAFRAMGLDLTLGGTDRVGVVGTGQTAIDSEDCRIAADAYRLFLGLYLNAYHALSERERFVLQMVEVRGMRYAEVAKAIGIRPEALKMVVFRARRRIYARISAVLPSEEQPVVEAVREPALLAG